MFEQDQDVFNFLLENNDDFKRLYEKHSGLKNTINKANSGDISIDEPSLEQLKKEKLQLKDHMSIMIEDHKKASI